jgi:hypothetical protein
MSRRPLPRPQRRAAFAAHIYDAMVPAQISPNPARIAALIGHAPP